MPRRTANGETPCRQPCAMHDDYRGESPGLEIPASAHLSFPLLYVPVGPNNATALAARIAPARFMATAPRRLPLRSFRAFGPALGKNDLGTNL